MLEITIVPRKNNRIMFTVGSVDRYVGRYVGRLSVDTRPIYSDRLSVDIEQTHLDRVSVKFRWDIGQVSVTYW